jgi:myo-inositol-1(or 4)-monophosphatase
MVDLEQLLRLATRLVSEAGEMAAATAMEQRLPVSTKSSITDFVTAIDRSTEEFIFSRLLAARPEDSILGEEGLPVDGRSDVTWIVDPIDGSVNFTYGIPTFCTSIAAEVGGTISVGAVFDPSRGELFSARLDGGSYLNGNRLRLRPSVIPLHAALVGTGFDYRPERRLQQAIELVRILPAVGDIRRIGSAALELCWVACGRLDGYFESGTKPWDRAAGGLIASEAGARVLLRHEAASEDEVIFIASRPEIWDSLISILEAARQQ